VVEVLKAALIVEEALEVVVLVLLNDVVVVGVLLDVVVVLLIELHRKEADPIEEDLNVVQLVDQVVFVVGFVELVGVVVVVVAAAAAAAAVGIVVCIVADKPVVVGVPVDNLNLISKHQIKNKTFLEL